MKRGFPIRKKTNKKPARLQAFIFYGYCLMNFVTAFPLSVVVFRK